MAEGSTRSRAVTFTNADRELIDDCAEAAGELGFELVPVSRNPKSKSAGVQWRINGAAQWARLNGLVGCLATDKRIPAWVFRLPERQKWAFLAVMFDTDGWASVDGRLGITLANEELIEDLRNLFTQVGVVTTMTRQRNDYAGAWNLQVESGHVQRCIDNMPLKLKGERLSERFVANGKRRYGLIDAYPPDVATGLPKGMCARLHNLGIRFSKGRLTREKLQRVMAIESCERWDALEDFDVFWDRIVAIEQVGPRRTFDVTVPGNHNLIVEGLVTHNSTTLELVVRR